MVLSIARRSWLAAISLGAVLGPLPAHAEWPDRPIRFVVNAAAGGAADGTARVLAEGLSKRLGQAIIIDNKPGASGVIGLEVVAKAAPDGYTIGNANLATYTVTALTAKSLPYDPARDFTPIARQWTQPNLLGVSPKLPVKTVAQFVDYAKAHPGEVFYGSTGTGTALHVLGALFGNLSGAHLTHVPYKSAPAAELDLSTGQIQMMFSNFTSMEPQVRAGRIHALAITGPTRAASLPDVPTVREAGYPALEMETWGGVVGPANMPPAIVDRLNREINAVLADPAVIKKHENLGAKVAPASVAEFKQMLDADSARWGEVIKRNHITLE
ncbi:Bug family tripartite tricarboxylate transporter substrate binding protein [Achromobacter aloeverae]|uniref:Tripartite tricarboxylate transporter substrate binding protein n=1 Tax=Achromobacter aloeverae TaxID=1750518 RepID=A0A4Q1HFW6_9BURK|nr:tripartite tricarboxylate transporter substrate binding protein [Achromobacter aloeverae]RXN86035.1 tripartite tricarboxylate transporter substrate binding protein [Achromobacter aloeverae]